MISPFPRPSGRGSIAALGLSFTWFEFHFLPPAIRPGLHCGNDIAGTFATGRADNAAHVVTVAAAQTAAAVIDGFTIAGGNNATPNTGGGVGPHDLAWIRRHLPANGAVQVRDIIRQYATVGLWGPQARAV